METAMNGIATITNIEARALAHFATYLYLPQS